MTEDDLDKVLRKQWRRKQHLTNVVEANIDDLFLEVWLISIDRYGT